MSAAVLFASTLGNLFKPLYEAMAWLIAFFYRIIPNYAFAIAMLTIVVMAITAPLTVKSTKSMASMQRLGPELKKIQQKYKGDRTRLNEEMMKLYKEHGVNPAGGCLPMLLQFPVFIVLYGVIRGLTNTVTNGAKLPYTYVAGHYNPNLPSVCHAATGHACAAPRYISTSSKMYQNLVASHGQMKAFGINLSDKALGHHGSLASALPYWGIVIIAIGLQYLQMRQLNSRNPQYAQSNPQAAMLQKYMPIIFGFIYLTIAAGVNVYFIVSSLCRIGIQEAVFRSGVLDKKPVPKEEVLPGRTGAAAAAAPRRRSLMDRLADAQAKALDAQKAQKQREEALKAEAREVTKDRGPAKGGASANGGRQPTSSNGPGGNGKNGSRSPGTAGKQTGASGASSSAGKPSSSHPRAKGKRARKAR
jgi:YidC/Oxa1 family membrane protein insertase